MYECVYTYFCVRHAYMHIHTWTHKSFVIEHEFAVHTNIHTCFHTHAQTHTCIYIYIYIYDHIRTYIHTYIHTYIQMLPDYISHMQDNPDSLLCRFFSLIRLQPNTRYFLVMGNILDSPRDIHEVCMCVPALKQVVHVCELQTFGMAST